MRDPPAGGEHPDGQARGGAHRRPDGSMSEYHSRQLSQKSREAWTTTPRTSRVACSTSKLRGGMQSIADELNAEGRKVRREDAEHDAQEPCYIGEHHYGNIAVEVRHTCAGQRGHVRQIDLITSTLPKGTLLFSTVLRQPESMDHACIGSLRDVTTQGESRHLLCRTTFLRTDSNYALPLICGVGRKNPQPELLLKYANAGLNCVDSVIAVNSNSNRHYKLHLTLCADVQAEMSLPSCKVSNRSTRARTEGRWETIR